MIGALYIDVFLVLKGKVYLKIDSLCCNGFLMIFYIFFIAFLSEWFSYDLYDFLDVLVVEMVFMIATIPCDPYDFYNSYDLELFIHTIQHAHVDTGWWVDQMS